MRRLLYIIAGIAVCLFAADSARAADLRVPQNAVAGAGVAIGTGGSGEGTLIVTGPGTMIKKKVKLGDEVNIPGDELRHAGRYLAILDGDAKAFNVTAAEAAKLNFLARPSRVPVSLPGVISGVAFVFDNYDNLVLQPTPVKFDLSVNGGSSLSKTVNSKDGIAWLKTNSASREGAAQFVASVGGTSVRRVVQQVASDPCGLRMKASRQGNALLVETDPVRDCSGNPVPDGTIVTFIQTGGGQGRSTVDARIKKGIARATLPVVPGSTLSVASGVVLGNEIRFGGGL
jgi:hypothetical protein